MSARWMHSALYPPPTPDTRVAIWAFDDAAGASLAVDSSTNANHGTYFGAVTGRAPLRSDEGSSIDLSGSGQVVAAHVSAYELDAGSVVLHAEPASTPAAGTNRQLFNKQDGTSDGSGIGTKQPGGVSIEQYSDAGASKLRTNIRNGALTAVWMDDGLGNSSNGVAALAEDVAHLIVLSWDTGRTPTHKLFLKSTGGAAALVATADILPGWSGNTAAVWMYRWPTLSAGFDGLGDHVEIHSFAMELADVESLEVPTTVTVARDDAVEVATSSTGNLLGVLSNDVGVSGFDIAITQALTGASIVNDQTASADISYNAPASAGAQVVKYTVDGSNEATVNINVTGGGGAQALPIAPATNAYWVDPISGSDSNSTSQARSASTSPPASNGWKTLAKAISEWNAGNLSASGSGDVEIILRGGLSYERGNNLTITRTATTGSHLVIKGYRSDIQTGTRGGTGKYTGAKGRFVLRGNIQALEAAGWEDDPARGRNIYRSSSTYTITGGAWANWLRDDTYNLQLVPARYIADLDTDTTNGTGAAVYTAPSIVDDSSRFYVRMDTNEWTDYWNPQMLSPAASWVTNPNTETLAVYDETHGLRFQGTIAFVDLSFFNIEYWWRAINTNLTSTIVNDLTMDYVTVKGGFHAIRFRELAQVNRLSLTHCDFIMNIPPWAARAWIHGNTNQARWDSFFVYVQAETSTDDVTVSHCRFVRPTDGYTQPDNSSIVSNVTFNNNHVLNARDDVMAFSVSAYNIEITYNYFQNSFLGIGAYAGSTAPANTNGWKIGFNIFDQRTYTNITGFAFTGDARFEPGASNSPSGGTGCGRLDPMHGAPSVWHERHWYHNTCLVAQDRNTLNGTGNAFGYKTENASIDTANPSTHYNNVIIQTNRCAVLGGCRADTLERDYNCSWVDPAGLFWNSTILIPRRTDGAAVAYSAWNDFLTSGTHYNQTKHANGPGPGSLSGWDANGIYADPDFVNGKWESIVRRDLSTYYPKVNGNLKFAVNLNVGATAAWPGIDATYEYVGAYQPGDPVTKIGPEQGLWVD